jgi:5-aminolevulinate synthase
LESYNTYVQSINYSTVARGTERSRLTPTLFNTDEDVDHLVNALATLWEGCSLAEAFKYAAE